MNITVSSSHAFTTTKSKKEQTYTFSFFQVYNKLVNTHFYSTLYFSTSIELFYRTFAHVHSMLEVNVRL